MTTNLTSLWRRHFGASSVTYWMWRQHRAGWLLTLVAMVLAPWLFGAIGWLFNAGCLPALWYFRHRAIADRQKRVEACTQRMMEVMRRRPGSDGDELLDGYSSAAHFLGRYAWATVRLQVVSTAPPDALRLMWRRYTDQVVLTFQGDHVDCSMVRDAVPYSLQWSSADAVPQAVLDHLKTLC